MNKEEKLALWGNGEWMGEPDFLEWKDRGIFCMIQRNTMGTLCGYAVLPSGHPWEGIFYEEIEAEIHGGLTYSENTNQGYKIGFDCATWGDVVPYSKNSFGRSKVYKQHEKEYGKVQEQYRNIDFVKNELKNLVTQILQAIK